MIKFRENSGPAEELVEATSRCWCSKSKQKFGVVLINVESKWQVKHSFLCSPKYVDVDSELAIIKGQIGLSEKYNGCKFCENDTLVQCGTCKAYSCGPSGGLSPVKTSKCGKCGARGLIAGIASSMNISGD